MADFPSATLGAGRRMALDQGVSLGVSSRVLVLAGLDWLSMAPCVSAVLAVVRV